MPAMPIAGSDFKITKIRIVKAGNISSAYKNSQKTPPAQYPKNAATCQNTFFFAADKAYEVRCGFARGKGKRESGMALFDDLRDIRRLPGQMLAAIDSNHLSGHGARR